MKIKKIEIKVNSRERKTLNSKFGWKNVKNALKLRVNDDLYEYILEEAFLYHEAELLIVSEDERGELAETFKYEEIEEFLDAIMEINDYKKRMILYRFYTFAAEMVRDKETQGFLDAKTNAIKEDISEILEKHLKIE
jgi:hypothetical protein